VKKNVELSEDGRRLIARRLSALLDEHGMSLRELADRSGVGVGTVMEIGRGDREPSLSTLLAFARVLQLRSIEELFAAGFADAASDGAGVGALARQLAAVSR
jgi:transcriptional regulator with XRE-family HTH domain